MPEPISAAFQKGKFPLLVLVTGKTCAPCRELKRKLTDQKIKFQEADMEQNMEFCMAHRVMRVPTLLLFTAADRHRNVAPADATVENLRKWGMA